MYRLNQDFFNENGKKRCLVIVSVGIQRIEGLLILDPIDLCRKYSELNVKFGFTLDNPLSDNATEKEYKEKLMESFEWAEIMFRYRPSLCPNTNLLIPLHYTTKDHLVEYYAKMAILNPIGYAIPVRNTNNWDDFGRIAYCLCFLHNEGIQCIHLFGSCRAEIIVLGAAAIRLRMFDQISFDSTSWRTLRWGDDYLDPNTLKKIPIHENHVRILLPDKVLESVKSNKALLTMVEFKRLILLHNVLAVDSYRKRILQKAKSIHALKRFVKSSRHLRLQRGRLLHTIDMMEKAVKKGYGYIEKRYGCIWY